jgi:hypothetical protein
MYKYTEFPSGSVMCTAPHGKGHVCILCDDPDLTPLQRADKARQQVDEILVRLTANTQLQQPVLTEVHAAPAHRRESSA